MDNGIMECGHNKSERDEIFTCIPCYTARKLAAKELAQAVVNRIPQPLYSDPLYILALKVLQVPPE